MCGIAGFIGKSKDIRLTYSLTKSIFKKLEVRGTHASGVFAIDDKNQVYFDKKPIISSEFVNTNFFKSLEDKNLHLCLLHARQATPMCGNPEDNINNHPFVSEDGKKILTHNGMVDREEYNALISMFPTESTCDSEVLLKFMEKNEDNTVKSFGKLMGLTVKSQFAISYVDFNEKETNLYLIRNAARPLYVFDLTETLGQIFFCSTTEIFVQALSRFKRSQEIMNDCTFNRTLPYKLYNFKYTNGEIRRKYHSIKLHKEVVIEYG